MNKIIQKEMKQLMIQVFDDGFNRPTMNDKMFEAYAMAAGMISNGVKYREDIVATCYNWITKK